MRHNETTRRRRDRKKGAVLVLILLGLAACVPPSSRAEFRNSGARVQVHRSDQSSPGRTSSKSAAPQTITSFYPDNDFVYPSSVAGGAARPASPPVGQPPYGIPAALLPWNQAGFDGYDESREIAGAASDSSGRKYSLHVTALPPGTPGASPNAAELIAYLPEHALVWVDDQRTRSTGSTRYFQSPPLLPGRKYTYTVRAAWREDGQWVRQTQAVAVQAASIQAIYLQPSPALTATKKLEARIEANLAKLPPEDREVARRQKVCVIHNEVRLGEKGVPIEVTLKNHRVFVCEEGCVKQALADPEGNRGKAQALQAKGVAASPGK